MPLFRRKTETTLSRASSISVYGQGRPQVSHNTKNPEKFSDSSSFSSLDLDDRPHPLAFAEATFDSSLPMKTKSRLSKDLGEVLNDNSVLAYFIQFMEANNAKHLVKFWLEAESFRSSSETKRKDKKILPSRADDWNLLVSSSSSECVSDKSDKVFQSTSHTDSSSTEMDQNRMSDVKNVQESSSENSKKVNNIDFVPASSSFKETVRLVHTSENSSKRSKSINHNTSLDSEKEEKSVFQANSLFKDLTKDVEIQNSDHLIKCNPVVSNVYNIKFSNVQKKWEQDSKISSCSEKDLDLVKDELVKCETSVEQDANSIYCKYIAPEAPFPIGICDELRIAIENNIFKSSGDIDPHCFVPAREFVVRKMDKEFFPNFLRSSFHCKHQIDVLTSGTVFLADVLYNDSALFFFMEFMEQEGVRHLVDFLLMADNFQKHLLAQGQYDGIQAQTDAMVLYEKYFSLQATMPLGFSDEVRYEVEANICREDGPLPDCFLKPVKILMQYLEKTFLLQFLSSQLYFKYISECIIIIQSGGNEVAMQQKYPASDSGSEQSLPISSINTLLAMDSKQPGTSKVIKNLDDQDMRIDTQQFRPDALWKRPLAGRLQMAHVDHLGRVTTEFEPEPDRRRESRISKAVKKLVNWEEDKNQEDMAWKVAEMIVKDICSVTMPEANNSVHESSPS